MKFRCGFVASFVGMLFVSTPVFATTYSHDVKVRFNINSEINVVIDTADIEILDLAPGTSSDSNVVGITISTNSVAGYTASATVGNSTYNTTSMVHDNGTSSFSSLGTDASVASLSTDNTWGYATSSDNGSSWSNFSGLPIYTETAKQIASTDSPVNDAIKFKINAKAAASQSAGDYKNVINFTVVANVPPRTFEDVLESDPSTPTDPVTLLPAIQSITEEVCDAVEAIDAQSRVTDLRDHKTYFVAKLKDGHCWMTENLDLDLDSTKTYTNNDTDLGWNGSSYTTASWQPTNSTIASDQIDINGYIIGWQADANVPYSFDSGDWYWDNTWYSSVENDYTNGGEGDKFREDEPFSNGEHGHVGNYYNYAAAIATNDASSYTSSSYDDPSLTPQNSICPKNWRLPTASSINSYNEYYNLLESYNAYISKDDKIISDPMYFVRAGFIDTDGDLRNSGYEGFYRASTVYNSNESYALDFYSDWMSPGYHRTRKEGWSVRCISRYSPSITVSFNNNSGDGYMSSQEVKRGKTIILNRNQFTRDGYTFIGWNTDANGYGVGYGDADEFTANLLNWSSDTVTLYAQWEEDAGSQGGGGSVGLTLQRAYEEAYLYNHGDYDAGDGSMHHKGMYVPVKDNQGNYTGAYFEADDPSDYEGIPARDLRFAIQDIDLMVEQNGVMLTVCERANVKGSDAHVLDLRDNKSYWITKLADGRCWMTQNLDLNLSTSVALTSDLTDLGWNAANRSYDYKTWTPNRTTIDATNVTNGVIPGWENSYDYDYSVDVGNWYWTDTYYGSAVYNYLNGGAGDKFRKNVPYVGNGERGHLGNYYGWRAATAGSLVGNSIPNDSICPRGWTLPVSRAGWEGTDWNDDFVILAGKYQLASDYNVYGGTGDIFIRAPLYFVRSGLIRLGELINSGYSGTYWTSGTNNNEYLPGNAWYLIFDSDRYNQWDHTYEIPHYTIGYDGRSVRCIAR